MVRTARAANRALQEWGCCSLAPEPAMSFSSYYASLKDGHACAHRSSCSPPPPIKFAATRAFCWVCTW
jgi:hypothetical protein